ncbi:MAG: metallophosphoesterase, partial [Bacteroidota bacterium]|nr:metallophosphoesterase [Bacteroidota bacterium]
MMKKIFILLLIILAPYVLFAQTWPSSLKGRWTFDDASNHLKAVVGEDLKLNGSDQPAIDGPTTADKAVRIGKGSYLSCTHNISANGSGNNVNRYSLLIDFRIAFLGQYYSFFQTNPANNDDADFCVNPNGNIGIATLGYSSFSVTPGQWYRMVVTVDMGAAINTYIDGNLINKGNMTQSTTAVDGRWSLSPSTALNNVLLFADDNGEDNDIDVAQVAIFDKPLSETEITALGKFDHPKIPIKPYLETPTPTSIYINWQDTCRMDNKVVYGTDSLSLKSSAVGVDQDISGKMWHTVKLNDLIPNTTYYYKCISGADSSNVCPFHTPALPGNSEGHVRFAIIGDSQDHPAQAAKTANAMKTKFIELYGADWYNKVNLILHTGDIVGYSSISNYETQYFEPFSILTGSVPFMIATGNHDLDANGLFYKLMHYEDFSDAQYPDARCEKYYSFSIGNVQFIATYSADATYTNSAQRNWLKQKLNASKDNGLIDFVFVYGHKGRSELWPIGDDPYVPDSIFSALADYPKVAMYLCGHSHNYEYGTHLANNNERRDFRTLIFGGAGGDLDRWGASANIDLPDVHKSYDYYGYTIVDVDIKNKSYTATAYSLGNPNVPMNNAVLDRWHGIVGRSAPAKPLAKCPDSVIKTTQPVLEASAFIGADSDSLMSSQFQIARLPGDFNKPLVDTIRHWVNIYEVDASYVPINKN